MQTFAVFGSGSLLPWPFVNAADVTWAPRRALLELIAPVDAPQAFARPISVGYAILGRRIYHNGLMAWVSSAGCAATYQVHLNSHRIRVLAGYQFWTMQSPDPCLIDRLHSWRKEPSVASTQVKARERHHSSSFLSLPIYGVGDSG